MLPDGWIAHRRDDGETLGWIRAHGDGWIAADLLGHDVTDATEWLDAEAALEDRGIGWLADPWELDVEGVDHPVPVRMVEVTPERVIVKTEDWGAIDAPLTYHELTWPAPAALRPRGSSAPQPW